MTPRKLVWKELWQRPTAMGTCLLAIMLGVTALVAIRSVTVYSEKTVARQMSELVQFPSATGSARPFAFERRRVALGQVRLERPVIVERRLQDEEPHEVCAVGDTAMLARLVVAVTGPVVALLARLDEAVAMDVAQAGDVVGAGRARRGVQIEYRIAGDLDRLGEWLGAVHQQILPGVKGPRTCSGSSLQGRNHSHLWRS